MLGTLVNTGAVIVGSLIGLLFKKGLPARFSEIVMKGVGLCVMYIGISGTLKGENALIAIISIVVGAIIGELLRLEEGLNRIGGWIEKKFKPKDGSVSVTEGFVTASLLFCVGAMTIVGSLQSGISGDNTMLYTKSLLDFISAIIFASALGFGVIFSAFAILLIQGTITLLAQWVAPVLSDASIAEMTCVGSIIIIGLALNMLGLTKLKVMNYVPAIFIPIVLCMFM